MKTLHCCLLVCFAFLTSHASDWPRWGGPDGTGHASADALPLKSLPSEAKAVWRFKIGDGHAAPVVAGGKVFYADNQDGKETAHAVDAASGKILWSVAIDDIFKDHQSSPGPRCAPLADGDRVYVQSCRGEFQCLNAADGKKLWHVNFVKDFNAFFTGEVGDSIGAVRHGYTGPAMIDGDRIIVGVGGTNGASMVAFNKRTGAVIWKSQSDAAGYCGPIMTSIDGVKQVVIFTAESVMGLAQTDGALLWRYPVKTGYGRHAMVPVVVGNIVVVGSHQAGLIGIRVIRDGAGFKAENAWLVKNLGVNFSSPVAVDHYLYGLYQGKKIACVDVLTGEKAWSVENAFNPGLETDFAAFVVLGNHILTLGSNGQLLLFAADPKGYHEEGSLAVCDRTWCNPAYADGKLYLRDANELMCIQLASGKAAIPDAVKRVVFLGDSITYAGQYVSFVEAYFVTRYPGRSIEFINVGLPSETAAGLSEEGHAGGQFPRPDLHERLARVLARTKPDMVFACYGINDGIYMPLSEERFQKFKDGMTWLHQQVTATGAKIVHVTPPTFDDKKGGHPGYNTVLDTYSEWLVNQRSIGWDVADLHSGMNRFLFSEREKNPEYALAGDGVHPGDLGHWIMAREILAYLGGSDVIGTSDAKAMAAQHANGEQILKLVSERQAMMKDAWLTATRYIRPGMTTGLPLPEAQAKAAEIEKQIRQLAQPGE